MITQSISWSSNELQCQMHWNTISSCFFPNGILMEEDGCKDTQSGHKWCLPILAWGPLSSTVCIHPKDWFTTLVPTIANHEMWEPLQKIFLQWNNHKQIGNGNLESNQTKKSCVADSFSAPKQCQFPTPPKSCGTLVSPLIGVITPIIH